MSKNHQEKMSLLIGETYGIDTTSLRFFLVYGSRQSLSYPYTGVLSIFCSNLLSGNSPIIFEDGQQTRDFINVKDVCQALNLSMGKTSAKGEFFDVGTGNPLKIRSVADTLIAKINPEIKPIITNNYRVGDIGHCYVDISKIKKKLEFQPKISFEDVLEELIN